MDRKLEHYFDIHTFLCDVNRYAKHQNMSRMELADLCELSPTTLINLFKRRNNPTFVTLILLANLADLSLDKYRKDSNGYNPGPMVEVKRRTGHASTAWYSLH